ncbi:MAG: endo alpha-1,4 polygalactosaminidase [Lachnospiraceae bacterium]|nr:endo alpha-1,4 polygalactosaminidase [Lachnospiraceae bacterium]
MTGNCAVVSLSCLCSYYRNKVTEYKPILILVILTCVSLAGCAVTNEYKMENSDYGVFIGADKETLNTILDDSGNYEIAVIEGQEFSADEISGFKVGGRRIYSYLNIGSLETFRPYYTDFENDILGEYENWPDEYWIDVSDKRWQDYISETLAGELYEKGVDGFFIDNCDVYYQYQTAEIYDGLVNIMEWLNKYDVDIIINGGNDFVSKLILDGKSGLIDGVNQEGVFSSIKDYDNDVFAKQDKDETEYFTRYLDMAKKAGFDVYMLEYTTDSELAKEIAAYCSREGFKYYISCSVGLDG